MQPDEIEVVGTNPGVYPVLETWEWPVAAYLFLGGLVAGLMIFAGVLRLRRDERFRPAVRIADIAALPLLALGLVLLFLDLSNRWNAWRFFTTFQPRSAMSWGSWILAFSALLIVARLIVQPDLVDRWLPEPIRRRAGGVRQGLARFQRSLDVATIVFGVGLGIYTGVLLSSVHARPLWDSMFLAPLFLVSGMASGGAFLCLFLESDTHKKLAPVSMTLCGVELALIGGYLTALSIGSEPARRSVDLLLGGPFTIMFWTLVIGVGLLLPLSIEVGELRSRISGAVARLAPAFKLTGAAALRFVVLFAGLESFL